MHEMEPDCQDEKYKTNCSLDNFKMFENVKISWKIYLNIYGEKKNCLIQFLSSEGWIDRLWWFEVP